MSGERDVVWTALEGVEPGSLVPFPSREGGEDRCPRAIEVVALRPGLSRNGTRYSGRALMAAVPLWEGAAAFCDHPGPLDQGRAGGRSVRDLVGVYAEPRYEAGRGIVATLRLYPSADWLGRVIAAHLADAAAGRPTARLGISADMLVTRVPTGEVSGDGRPIFEATEILAVNSGDVVMNPAAGGSFERILEGNPDQPIAFFKDEGANSEMEETMSGSVAAVSNTNGEISDAAELATLKASLGEALLEARLSGSALPAKARTHLRERFGESARTGLVPNAEEIDRAIDGVRELLADAAAPGVIAGAGLGRAARVTLTGRDRLQVALDRLFGIEPADHLKDVPRLSGIREAYIALTGDRGFTGRYSFAESVLEANEITTSVMSDALVSALGKRLSLDYQAQPRWWEPIVAKVALSDMRTQTRVLLNDFASLASVNENSAYLNAAWGDAKESYTPGKRGNMVYVTLETIINDDLRTVQRIPGKLESAAVVTINETLAALFTANAGAGSALSDSNNVFDAANHQGNAGTSALSSTTLQAGMVALAKMTNSASKRIGVIGRYLLVPPDLMYTAAVIAGSTQVPGSGNNDINPLSGQIVPIIVPNFTDTNNWYLMSKPSQVECLEVGFLNGREEPELLIQDHPTDGSVFTNDAITFKVRHIYGAGWLDYRGAYGAIVA